jgi:SOS regulatory protein LexA
MDYKEKIFSFYHKHKRMPSYSEIMTLVGFKSKNAVSKLVHKLIDAGVLKKDAQGKLIPAVGAGEIPLLGLVEAGIPSLADSQTLDTLSIEEYLIPKKEKTFILEVKGDSMIEAHIDEGDLVIAERAQSARDGDIVVAEVDGAWTLKYFKTDGTKTWLMPANKNYKAIYPEFEMRIAAIVKGVIRKY